jgi:hypothetical protein
LQPILPKSDRLLDGVFDLGTKGLRVENPRLNVLNGGKRAMDELKGFKAGPAGFMEMVHLTH